MDILRKTGEIMREGKKEILEAEDKKRREAYNLFKASEQIYGVVGTLETEEVYGTRLVPQALASALVEIENDGDKEISQVITFSGGVRLGIQKLEGAVVIAKKKS